MKTSREHPLIPDTPSDLSILQLFTVDQLLIELPLAVAELWEEIEMQWQRLHERVPPDSLYKEIIDGQSMPDEDQCPDLNLRCFQLQPLPVRKAEQAPRASETE